MRKFVENFGRNLRTSFLMSAQKIEVIASNKEEGGKGYSNFAPMQILSFIKTPYLGSFI